MPQPGICFDQSTGRFPHTQDAQLGELVATVGAPVSVDIGVVGAAVVGSGITIDRPTTLAVPSNGSRASVYSNKYEKETGRSSKIDRFRALSFFIATFRLQNPQFSLRKMRKIKIAGRSVFYSDFWPVFFRLVTVPEVALSTPPLVKTQSPSVSWSQSSDSGGRNLDLFVFP